MTPYFTTSAKPERYSPLRQRLQRLGIDQYRHRLPERTNHVFRLRQIHSNFAADRTIDLGQQCGGHLHKWNSPGVGCRNKTGQIPHHSAADGNQQRRAIGSQLQQLLPQPIGLRNALGLLAGIDHQRIELHATGR